MRQVFGLASSAFRRLLSTLPNVAVSACVEVVLAYRCGAVPASHRVPFSTRLEDRAPEALPTLLGLVEKRQFNFEEKLENKKGAFLSEGT